MSTPATAAEEPHKGNENSNGNGTRSILETVLEQSDSVEAETDDLFDRASTAGQATFRREFESNVSSLKGFKNSFKDLVKSK